MPINYRELTQEQYNTLTGDLVKLTESLHARSQDVGDGRATMAMVTHSIVQTMLRSGLSPASTSRMHSADNWQRSMLQPLGTAQGWVCSLIVRSMLQRETGY